VKYFFIIFLFVGGHVKSEEDKYLCTTDKSTGFKYHEGKRVQTDLGVNKYILRKIQQDDKDKRFRLNDVYGLYPVGDDFAVIGCKDFIRNELISCVDDEGHFKFSKITGRFLRTHPHGYWLDAKDIVLTPFIEIGKCSRL